METLLLRDTRIGQQLAEDWLQSLRDGIVDSSYRDQLAGLDRLALANELNTDAKKLAFWINVYNAFAQIKLGNGAEAGQFNPEHAKSFGSIPARALPSSSLQLLQNVRLFTARDLVVAGQRLSLNDIEHGILRRSRLWWSPQFGRKIWPSAFELRLRADRLDPRIHFALNCAALSCPPIRFYQQEQIDQQLDLATMAYLENTVRFELANNLLELPAIFQMFRSDFNGRKGILLFLNRYRNFVDPVNPPHIRFQPFLTRRLLNNFADDAD